jgi:hypothetical protein
MMANLEGVIEMAIKVIVELQAKPGKRTELIGRLQERYGIAKEEAENQVDRWSNDLRF